ncbi:hypothetical protein TWF506_001834 [Arthrobotrys conoides]|uniref:Uncharacterized protein n=1 Tax=Arthrobotrys conoides TaxID=74498 RepID=A0AAN8P3G1_9PEZI
MSPMQEGSSNSGPGAQAGGPRDRLQGYSSELNTIHKPEVPATPIPTELIRKVIYVIRTLESRIAEEFSSRLFSTALKTPKDYGSIHQVVYRETFGRGGQSIYLKHRPGYRPHRPIPFSWRRNRETPVFRPFDIEVYEQYPRQYRSTLLLIEILKEMHIDPMDWMMVQRKMALSAPHFEKGPPIRTDAREWGPTVRLLVEKMSPKWASAFTAPLCRIVEQAMESSMKESDKLVEMVSPGAFGTLRASIMKLSMI